MKSKVVIISLLVVLCAACGSKQSEGLNEAHSVKAKAKMFIADVADMKQENVAQSSMEAGGSSVSARPEMDEAVAVKPDAMNPVTVNKKLIKDGNMRIETKDIQASKQRMDGLLKQYNGYYESENLDNNDFETSYNLKIRIPAQSFEALIGALENGEDEVKSKYIQARDVTEEYIDVESRLNNERAYLERYKALLAKASTVKDILAIEESIRTIQEEIESREGRLKYLNDQIAFSTLDVQLVKKHPYKFTSKQKAPFWERMKKSLSNGWSFTIGLALALVSLWPVWLIGAAVIVVVKQSRKRRKEKQVDGD